MWKMTSWASLVVVFGKISPSWAEPSTTIRRLMNEPMSVFDWGLVRMETELQEDFKSIGFDGTKQLKPSKVYVQYESKINSIRIVIFSYPKQALLKVMPAKEICKNVTNYVRRFFDTSMPKNMRAQTGITKYFETSSFGISTEKTLDELEAITRTKVNIGGNQTD